MSTRDGYVGLIKLPDFRKFLEDEPNVLAERIFESNVRGFAQDSTVNDAIATSLKNPKGEPNFWLLNNGVTIIAAKTAPAHLELTVDDPQIVNGLQTSRLIFDNLASNSKDDRTVLVRVIETTDQPTQDRIIKATNSQNRMQPASLRMTDQIHRDIEQLFKGDGLFYDRRKGLYKDQGKPIKRIVSVNAVAQAIISVMLQRPDDARARPGDYFKDDDRYNSIFANAKIPLAAYLACVRIIRRVEEFLGKAGVDRSDRKNLIFYLAALVTREATGMKFPVAAKLSSALSEKALNVSLKNIQKIYHNLVQNADGDSVARGPLLLSKINSRWERRRRSDRKARRK